jgi:hypothetical protein
MNLKFHTDDRSVARSNTYTVSSRSNIRIVSSIHARVLPCVVLSRADKGIAIDPTPVTKVLPNIYIIQFFRTNSEPE